MGVFRCVEVVCGRNSCVCSTYRIQSKRRVGSRRAEGGDAATVQEVVSEVAERLDSGLIRRSDPGVVLRADGHAVVMRWGYGRDFNAAIPNARADRLQAGMWKASFAGRRCAIPMSLFYEWGAGAVGGGRKPAYAFRDPGGGYLWAAGLWELHPELGPCYAMITTEASPLMAPIHDRMPALLRPEAVAQWLRSTGDWPFRAYDGPLEAAACESPLLSGRGQGGEQMELF